MGPISLSVALLPLVLCSSAPPPTHPEDNKFATLSCPLRASGSPQAAGTSFLLHGLTKMNGHAAHTAPSPTPTKGTSHAHTGTRAYNTF